MKIQTYFIAFILPTFSAHTIVKSALYRGMDCISTLLDTLRLWLKSAYDENKNSGVSVLPKENVYDYCHLFKFFAVFVVKWFPIPKELSITVI